MIALETRPNSKHLQTTNNHFEPYRIENIVGKGENAGYQHFPLLPQCFQNL